MDRASSTGAGRVIVATLALALVMALAPYVAGARIANRAVAARSNVIPQTSNVAEAANCKMNSLAGLMRQGEFSQVGEVGDVIQIECNPAVFPGGTPVRISDSQLYNRCNATGADGTIHWATLVDPVGTGPEAWVVLDGDGNGTVDLVAGPNCAVGGTVVSANTEVGDGNTVVESFSAGFAVEPAVPSTEGVTVEPKEQVEDETTSSASTLIEAEFGSTEAKVRVAAPELDGSCEVGGSLFLRPNGELVPARELVGGENKVDPTGKEAIATDDDGNAFVIAIGFGSCKPGKSYFQVDEEASPFNTEEVPFTILPPQPTEEPAFTIEKLQEIVGSGAGFTTSPLTGAVGQTVAYEIVVKNTAKVTETISEFADPHCDPATTAGDAGSRTLAAGASTTYTCQHVLTAVGSYTNSATATGRSAGGTPLQLTSNTVEVTVPVPAAPKPGFSIEKLQQIAGSGKSFTTSPLTATVEQTVEYEIVVTNTGNVPLKFGKLSDANCENITPAGEEEIAVSAHETYTCNHVLTTVGSYTNEATVTGTPEGEAPVTHTSNQVVVEVPAKPAFTIVKLQEINSSGLGFTTALLTGAIGQAVNYEIVVTNTGNVPLKFGKLSDANCENITPAGEEEIAVSAHETYTCNHVLTTVGSYTNEATVTGTPEGETPVTHTSNQVVVEVPPPGPHEASFTIEKQQEIKGSAAGFTPLTLIGAVNQTVDYEIVVTNTGNVPLKFGKLSDASCENITPAGEEEITASAHETYTCDHVLTAVGSYTNVATVTGTPELEAPITHNSNQVLVEVPEPKVPPVEPKVPPVEPKVPPVEPKIPLVGTMPGALTSPPPPTPKNGVLAECERLAPLQGASGPKRRTFTVQTGSIGIKQITFYLDGRKLKTLKQSQAERGKFTVEINPLKLSFGAHKLLVKTLMSNPNCKAPARSSVFVRPLSQRVAPKFTG